jgi:tetratricopeptide (TPR) repeat protein
MTSLIRYGSIFGSILRYRFNVRYCHHHSDKGSKKLSKTQLSYNDSQSQAQIQLSKDELDRKIVADYLNNQGNPVTMYNYATYCLKTGYIRQSNELFNEMTRSIFPLHHYADNGTNYWTWRYNMLYNHGVALRREGRGSEAIDIFLECAEIKCDNNVQCELGFLYLTVCRDAGFELSRDYFEKVLQNDPENYLAYYYLTSINKMINAKINQPYHQDEIQYFFNTLSMQFDDFWGKRNIFEEPMMLISNDFSSRYALQPYVTMPYLLAKRQ